MAQLVDQRRDLVGQLDVEVFPQPLLVQPRLQDRLAGIPGIGEGVHEAQHRARAVGLGLGQTLPPGDRGAGVPSRLGRFGQPLQRSCTGPRQAVPLALGPALEFFGVGKKKTVQEGRTALGDGRSTVVAIERIQESADITFDARGVEVQCVALGEDDVATKTAAEHVNRIGKEMAAAFRVCFRPEQGDQLVAAHAGIPGNDQEREERKPMMLRDRPEMGHPLQSRPAEQLEADHPASAEREVIAAGEGEGASLLL